jgi:hypothetical protein
MSIEDIFPANAALVAATSHVPPHASTAVSTSLRPITTSQQATQVISPTLISTAPVDQAAMPAGITLTPEQWAVYTSTHARIAELELAEQKRAAEADAAEVKALQAKGQIEAAFNLQREQARQELEAERKKLRETQDRAKRYALDGELARALAAQPLVPGGADQLTQLWRHQFTVEAQGDTFTVRTPDFQPVGTWIAAQLGRPEYAHFLRAQNTSGGTAGTTSTQSVQNSGTADPTTTPRNLGDAIVAHMTDIAKRHTSDAIRTGGAKLGENGQVIKERAAGFGLRPLSVR